MSAQYEGRPVEILLVEDNPGDVRLTTEVFKHGKILTNLHAVEDGEEAMAFLRRQGKYSHSVRPDLILLDLNMPRKDGLEALEEIKADQHLKDIPVIILTGSAAEKDILQSYDLHADGYVIKPLDHGRFTAIVQFIKNLPDDPIGQTSQ